MISHIFYNCNFLRLNEFACELLDWIYLQKFSHSERIHKACPLYEILCGPEVAMGERRPFHKSCTCGLNCESKHALPGLAY